MTESSPGTDGRIGPLLVELFRVVALTILLANLLIGTDHVEHVEATGVILYGAVTAVSMTIAIGHFDVRRIRTLVVVLDALSVVLVLYTQILQAPVDHAHSLTTTGLVVAFILLNHVGLTSNHKSVLVFSGIVILSWISFLLLLASRNSEAGNFLDTFANRDLGLAASFTFTAMAVYVVAKQHDVIQGQVRRVDKMRINLTRFFSPLVASDLQEGGPTLNLDRKRAAIMFIDLRNFTSFAEMSSPRELAFILAEYRHLVAEVVLKYHGTIDKFIGDGVMAVFGHPKGSHNDPERALAAALELVEHLQDWKLENFRKGFPALDAGIGLHYGMVIGGVLESGLHSEYTVLGDVVNVAQRLENMSKTLDSPLVVSVAVLKGIKSSDVKKIPWNVQKGVTLTGRKLPLDIVYLPRSMAPSTS